MPEHAPSGPLRHFLAVIPAFLACAGRSCIGASFPDAELPEDHVQQILDVDPAGQPAQRAGGEAELLGDDVLAAARPLGQRAVERGLRLDQETPVAFPADQRRLAGKRFGSMGGQSIDQ